MPKPIDLSSLAKLLSIAFAGWLTSCQPSQPPQNVVESSNSTASAAQPITYGDSRGTLEHQGQQRTYHLYTPKSYRRDRLMPLVLAFHGYGSQGKDLAANTGLNQLADQQGFLVAYPDGIERRWNPLYKALTGVDDVSFVPALIQHLKQERTIDPRRIYAAGVSNGGFLVQRLACESSVPIAAFASVVASFPSLLQGSCHPNRPIPMLMINGTADTKVPWQGGNLPYGSLLPVPATIGFWQQYNNCPSPAPLKRLSNNRVEIERYPNCKGGSEVELVKLNGVGHVWPRGGSGPAQLLNGSQEIWAFFQRHTLP